MYSFGKRSRENLAQCHPDLQRLFNEVIKYRDCSVICGHRSEIEQSSAYLKGLSKLRFPQSKHNTSPSMAVDVVPYPIDWEDTGRFYAFAGYVQALADTLGIKIRWGGDWDMDLSTTDQRFHDLPHYEIST